LDVARECARLRGEAALLDGAHQVDATARAVILVARLDVSRAGFEAQAAVNARQKLALLRGQRARKLCRTFRHEIESNGPAECKTTGRESVCGVELFFHAPHQE